MDDQVFAQLVTVIAALADRTRLGMLAQLQAGELAVGELQRRLGISQPMTSYHLRVLAEAGVVRARRAGTSIFYAVDADGWDAAVTVFTTVFAPSF